MNTLDTLERRALDLARAGAWLECRYNGIGGCAALCNVVIVAGKGRAVVLFSERIDNPGTSVTNWFEKLATGVYRQHLRDFPPNAVRWLEHYPAEARSAAVETLDRVEMAWDGQVFGPPTWKYVEVRDPDALAHA